MLVLDDLLFLPFDMLDINPLRLLNINLPPNIFIMIFESLDNYAQDKLMEEINNYIKEYRMLYELGELSRKDYENVNERLMKQLRLAKKATSAGYEARISTVEQ